MSQLVSPQAYEELLEQMQDPHERALLIEQAHRDLKAIEEEYNLLYGEGEDEQLLSHLDEMDI